MQGISMYELAAEVSNTVGHPVVDATGLNGHYDLRLDMQTFGMNVKDGMDKGTALIIELQDQLGLKFESRKDWIVVLVIDHAEKTPKQN
jgi:uncharacterized protein (TIGR03435 family)